MAKVYRTRIMCKYDTKANWENSSLILLEGELAVASDSGSFRVKVGDGSHTYSQLPFVTNYTISDTGSGEFVTGATLNPATGVITLTRGSVTVGAATGTGNVVTGIGRSVSGGVVTLTPQKNSTAVLEGDSRLTDARTPTAHAATHGASGSDPITIAESQVTNLTSDLAGKYVKPTGGIPATDLASAVQTSLGKADTAVQPAALDGYVAKSAANNGQIYYKSSAGAVAGISYGAGAAGSAIVQRKSDAQITVPATPTASTDAASKSYVDAKAASAVEYLGMAANKATVLAATTAGKGDFFRASAQFTINGQTAYSGDLIIAREDGAGAQETNWDVIHGGETSAPNDGVLTLSTAGGNLSGSATFSANQSANSSFTVTHTGPGTGSALTPSAGSGRTYITEVSADANGHITGVKTATESAVSANNPQINISAGGGLSGGGNFTLNQSGAATVTVSHGAKPTTGSAATASAGSGTTFITEVDTDTYGHVSGVKRATYNPPVYTGFTRTNEGFTPASGEEKDSTHAKLLSDTGVWVEELILDCGSSVTNVFGTHSVSFRSDALEAGRSVTEYPIAFKFGSLSSASMTYDQVKGKTFNCDHFYVSGNAYETWILEYDETHDESEYFHVSGTSFVEFDVNEPISITSIRLDK